MQAGRIGRPRAGCERQSVGTAVFDFSSRRRCFAQVCAFILLRSCLVSLKSVRDGACVRCITATATMAASGAFFFWFVFSHFQLFSPLS